MKKETYQRMMNYWRTHPHQMRALVALNKLITACIYVIYPCFLAYLLFTAPLAITIQTTVIPLIGFLGVSALRTCLNAPRPYQVFRTSPAIPKDTEGKSLPSKHTFCIFIIGIAFLASAPTSTIGILILILGVILGTIRVISGVHFVRDVLAAAMLAILLGGIGFYVT